MKLFGRKPSRELHSELRIKSRLRSSEASVSSAPRNVIKQLALFSLATLAGLALTACGPSSTHPTEKYRGLEDRAVQPGEERSTRQQSYVPPDMLSLTPLAEEKNVAVFEVGQNNEYKLVARVNNPNVRFNLRLVDSPSEKAVLEPLEDAQFPNTWVLRWDARNYLKANEGWSIARFRIAFDIEALQAADVHTQQFIAGLHKEKTLDITVTPSDATAEIIDFKVDQRGASLLAREGGRKVIKALSLQADQTVKLSLKVKNPGSNRLFPPMVLPGAMKNSLEHTINACRLLELSDPSLESTDTWKFNLEFSADLTQLNALMERHNAGIAEEKKIQMADSNTEFTCLLTLYSSSRAPSDEIPLRIKVRTPTPPEAATEADATADPDPGTGTGPAANTTADPNKDKGDQSQ